MSDTQMAERVKQAANLFNVALREAMGAGLEVTVEYREPEKMEMYQREPLFIGGGLTARVVRPVPSDA